MALPTTTYAKATITNPAQILNDFLFIVDLSTLPDSWWDEVNATDGARGRAAKDSGVVELSTDWFQFNSVAKTGFVRVAWVGQLLSAGTQEIRIYPPNSNNSILSKTDTFGSDNCYNPANVFFYSPNGGNNDRSSNSFVLSERGGVFSGNTTGQIGDATTFNGSTQYLTGIIPDLDQPLTIMAWYNSPTHTDTKSITVVTDGTNVDMIRLVFQSETQQISIRASGTNDFLFGSIGVATGGVWNHIVGNCPDTTHIELYLNGAADGTRTTPSISPVVNQLDIGARFTDGIITLPFDGSIQEVFYFTDSKSAEWIAYEHSQTSDNATFWGTWATPLPNTPYATATITNPASILDDFLFMLDLSTLPDSWWDQVDTNEPTRGRAAKDSGSIEIATDWFQFNRTAKTGFVRVGWEGQLLAAGTQIIRIYPPKAANILLSNTSAFGSNNVYDPANVFIYSPNGGNNDRSSNALTLTETGGVVSGDSVGQIGDATEFDGSTQYLSTNISDQDESLTMMCWVNPASSNNMEVFGLGDSTTDFSGMNITLFGNLVVQTLQDGAATAATAAAISTGVWSHAAGTVNSTTSVSAYTNGIFGSTVTGSALNPTVDRLRLGATSAGTIGTFYGGLLQEVFIFTDVKSNDWIAYEHSQTDDNATFWGAWSMVGVPSTAFLFDVRVFNKKLDEEGGITIPGSPNLDKGTITYAFDDVVDNEGKSTLPFG